MKLSKPGGVLVLSKVSEKHDDIFSLFTFGLVLKNSSFDWLMTTDVFRPGTEAERLVFCIQIVLKIKMLLATLKTEKIYREEVKY